MSVFRVSPVCPAEVDWSAHFPAFFPPTAAAAQPPAAADGSAAAAAAAEGEGGPSAARDGAAQQHATTAAPISNTGQPMVRFADVGCGFGGLLVKLSPMFPDTLMVGFELRDKVSEYVKDRILALRQQHPSQYTNISLIRTNAMKYLPNYFHKAQLTKMFFLFPDPHFKEKNHRRRIITTALLAEYAYVLAPGGILYSITDVEELGVWMDDHLAAHPLFRKLTPAQTETDPVIPLLSTSSEEGLKELQSPHPMPLTPCPSPHAPHPMPLTPCPSPHAPHPMSLTPCPSPHAPHPMPLTPCPSPMPLTPCSLTPCPSPHAPHPMPLTPCPSPHAPHPMPLTPCPSPHAPHPMPLTPCPSPHAPHPMPLTPCPSPHAPHPMPLTPCASPRVPHPMCLALCPSPRASHPMPLTPCPSPRVPHPVCLTPCASPYVPHREPLTCHPRVHFHCPCWSRWSATLPAGAKKRWAHVSGGVRAGCCACKQQHMRVVLA
ncbi:unnamed protein product [Closterium sp. Naga37s-1]|nr:unnamed protein product [Closterium sp. Naga37s-1]